MNTQQITNIYQYLEKYLPVLDAITDPAFDTKLAQLPLENSSKFTLNEKNKKAEVISPPIWQLCWQGKDFVPPVVKKCLSSVANFYPERHIIISESNYQDYIELPEYIYKKFQNRIINHAHLSDYIRLTLLEKYGGTWIDTTVFLSAPIPDNILNQDFFVFKFPLWNKLENIYKNTPRPLFDIKKGMDFPFRSCANWFIHSLQKNTLISSTKALLEIYWQEENEAVNYFLFHAFFSMTVLKKQECTDIFKKIKPVFTVEECHLLQYFLPREFSQETLSKIYASTSIHKLTYKYQKHENIQIPFIKYFLEN